MSCINRFPVYIFQTDEELVAFSHLLKTVSTFFLHKRAMHYQIIEEIMHFIAHYLYLYVFYVMFSSDTLL